MHIREYTQADYPAIAGLQNAVMPDFLAVPEDYIEADEHRAHDERLIFKRYMVEVDGRVVGVGEYEQSSWAYEPGKFYVVVRVLPEYQRRGIGSAMFDRLMADLQAYDLRKLQAGTREDIPAGMHFLEKRGFELENRVPRSELDLSSFDPTRFDGLEGKLAAQGITIKSQPELVADPQWQQKFYDLELVTSPDVPGFDGEFPPFAQYVAQVLEAPMMYREACFVAECDGQYVGMTNLWRDRASDMIYTGFTCTRREFRQRGVATAIKARSLQKAKADGHPAVRTDNEENNPMFQINLTLGFQPIPAWMFYKKDLEPAGSS